MAKVSALRQEQQLDWVDHIAPVDASPLEPATAAGPEGLDGPCLESYDHILVGFSGGKDSVACVLHLLESGVPREKIELWHHDIDGREGSRLMDWPVTPSYCRAFAEALGLSIFFSWKVPGRRVVSSGRCCARTHALRPFALKRPKASAPLVAVGGKHQLGENSPRLPPLWGSAGARRT
jgi:hypothetical protein